MIQSNIEQTMILSNADQTDVADPRQGPGVEVAQGEKVYFYPLIHQISSACRENAKPNENCLTMGRRERMLSHCLVEYNPRSRTSQKIDQLARSTYSRRLVEFTR